MEKMLLNDEMMERQERCIELEDRGYQFGDGVYEVVRVYDGQLYELERHVNRLYESASKIKINVPFTKAALRARLTALVEANELQLGIVYMQLTRGVAARTHPFPDEAVTPVFTAYTKEVPVPHSQLQSGVEAMTADDVRWLRCDIKSLNLLANVLAKEEVKQRGCYEAILHRDGVVTEGASSNIFIVAQGVVQTHPANHLILNGITRQVILQLCKENDLFIREEAFHTNELIQADEVFLASTISEVMPVIKVDGVAIGSGRPGEVTTKLQTLFQQTK